MNPFLSRYSGQSAAPVAPPQPAAPLQGMPQAQPMPQAPAQAMPQQQPSMPQPGQGAPPQDMGPFVNAMRMRFQGTPLGPHFDYLHGLHQKTLSMAQAAQADPAPPPVGTPAMQRPAMANPGYLKKVAQ